MAKDDDETARAQAAKRGTPFLNTEQAAAYLGLSERKLRYMRSRCTGPRYRLHSRFVRYHIDDLIVWSRSTSPSLDGPQKTERSQAGKSAQEASTGSHEGGRHSGDRARRNADRGDA